MGTSNAYCVHSESYIKSFSPFTVPRVLLDFMLLSQCHRYNQGLVSIILVMPQFLARFKRVSQNISGAGFWTGVLNAMIELGAFIGP